MGFVPLDRRQGWGKTVILGLEMHGSPLCLNPYEMLRGRSVSGALIGGLKPKSDIQLLAKRYIDKVCKIFGKNKHKNILLSILEVIN